MYKMHMKQSRSDRIFRVLRQTQLDRLRLSTDILLDRLIVLESVHTLKKASHT